jgi:hypothetical protein
MRPVGFQMDLEGGPWQEFDCVAGREAGNQRGTSFLTLYYCLQNHALSTRSRMLHPSASRTAEFSHSNCLFAHLRNKICRL